jgi:hypothetical protein
MDGDTLLEKIAKCEENYNNLIQNNIMASPTTSKLYIAYLKNCLFFNSSP